MSKNNLESLIESQQAINKSRTEVETKTSRIQTKVRHRWENREKMRNMVRLRKLINDMNEMCDEHFMVTIAAPVSVATFIYT
uniref:Uncharacterized protein n=1 Tax=Heterorhabditis bacteriophora TaxID=37862 RepID=A0A1I7XE94_HETBA